MTLTRSRLLRLQAATLVVLLLSLAGVSGQTAPAQAERTGRSFMWSFERDGRTGWLVGSLHLLTADAYPLPKAMEDAFARADTLVEEIDINEASDPKLAALILSKAMYPSGMTLSGQVSKETHALLTGWLARSGLTAATFELMKPWMVALTIQSLALQQIGFDAALGLDKYFSDASTRAGKRFIALETAAEQIEFLDRLSPRTQDLMLRESIEAVQKELDEIKTLMSAWRTGDAATVERLAVASMADSPEVYRSLLVDRNRRWMPAIEACASTRRCFIVVGAAHLVGPDGLIALLRQQGYTVQQQ
jgi:uncharacterized protein YbaP (TraB family)